MKLTLLVTPPVDGDEHIFIRVEGCCMCQGHHEMLPLMKIEIPIRIRGEHITYPFRIRCPNKHLQLLLKPPAEGEVEWHVAPTSTIPLEFQTPPVGEPKDRLISEP